MAQRSHFDDALVSGLANRTLWLAVALAYGTTACTSFRTAPVTQTKPADRVTVQSGRAFAMHSSDGLACATYRASGTVDGISGDTVRLRDISALSTQSGEPPECAALRAGWFVVAGESTPEILRRALDVRKTTKLVGVTFSVVVIVVIVGIVTSLPDVSSGPSSCPGC